MRKLLIKKLHNNAVSQQELYEKFILERSVICKPATIESYQNKILPFIRWIEKNNRIVDQVAVNSYILYLREKYQNSVTVNSCLRAIKTYIIWLHDLGQCELIKIKIKKDTLEVKNLYTSEEVAALIKEPDKECRWTELRNWAIVCTLIGTGMRISSLINLKIEDVDFNNDIITLTHTKNGKGQVLPLSIALKNTLKTYLSTWYNTPDGYLFPTQYNTRFAGSHSTTKIIAEYNHSRGVYKTSAHLIRHTFAHNYIMQNGDIFRLQKLLGHSDIEVTRIYSNISVDDLKKDFNKKNLLDLNNKKRIIK